MDSKLIREPLLREELFLVGRADVIGPSDTPIAFAKIPQGAVLGLSPPSSRAIIQAQILRNKITRSPKLEIDSLGLMRRALMPKPTRGSYEVWIAQPLRSCPST